MSAKRLPLLVMAIFLPAIFLYGCTPLNKPAEFEEAKCQFEYLGEDEIQCGYLSVPEDRSRRDSPTIRLHVAIVKPQEPEPAPDPVVILNGGPGGYTLDGMDYWLFMFGRVRTRRAVILFDQRGTGYSLPSLNCPEAEKQSYQELPENLSIATSNENYARAMQACRDRLVAQGIDLSAYTSAANAADVEDLRRALGYSQWNLYGSSYGTRLALTVMRDFPNGVRSVILDSVYPPQVDLYSTIGPNFERSLRLLFERCAADPKCDRSYPDLEATFYHLVNELDAEPRTLQIYHYSADHNYAGSYDVLLNGDRFIQTMFDMLYSTDLIPGLPRRIYLLKDGKTALLGDFLENWIFFNEYLSEGMGSSVQCNEEAPFGSIESMKIANAEVTARLRAFTDMTQAYKDCSAWVVSQPAAIENEAVVSSIPTLILAGEFDPITPPSWGRLAGETLNNSQFLQFPGFGHGVLGSGRDGGKCTLQITADFLDHPNQAVDSSCLEALEFEFLAH